jgi:hypothetical protein
MVAVSSSNRARSCRGPARRAEQGGGRACGACTRCLAVLLRAVLGSVRMLKVADDDLCTARNLQARPTSVCVLRQDVEESLGGDN